MHGLHCHSQRRESVACKAWKMLVSDTHQCCLLQLCCVLQRRVALVCLGHLGKIPGMCLVTALYCTGGCARIRCKIPLSTAGVRVAASIASVRVAASTAGPRTGMRTGAGAILISQADAILTSHNESLAASPATKICAIIGPFASADMIH